MSHKHSTQPEGVWVAVTHDWNWIPRFVSQDEVTCRRWAMTNYAEVYFWRFGTEFHEAVAEARK